MDVIGDTGRAPKEPIPDVPGRRAYILSGTRTLRVLSFGALVSVLAWVVFWGNWPVGLGVVATAFLGLLGTLYVATGYADQWRALYEDYRKVRVYAGMRNEQHAFAAGFIAVFKPLQGTVEQHLQERAYAVLKAHERKVRFYAAGVGDPSTQAQADADPEVMSHRLKDAADRQKADVERDIKESLENFRRARDLAEAQGYSVNESWKEYVSVAHLPRELKRTRPASIPGPVTTEEARDMTAGGSLPKDGKDCGCLVDDCRHTFVAVEGANEQPGQ
jgi:hypothetical protein